MSVINTNTAANNALRNLNIAQKAQASSSEKLSSGLRINRAADDAAGLAISEGLKSQVEGLGQASRNAQDGINLLQTAEGGLTEVHSILQRVRTLAVQAGNDTNNADSRAAITTEVGQLAEELTRMSESINFNGTKLLDGSATALTFQVGAGAAAAADQVSINLSGASATAVGTAVAALNFSDAANALTSLTAIDAQIKNISTARSTIGAMQNRLETTIRHVNVSKENLSAANSSIADTNMADEMVKSTRANILSQAGISVLSQANQAPQSVLKLLG